MSQPNNPQDDWRSPASRAPQRVSLGPLPKNDDSPKEPPGDSGRFRLPDPPSNESPRVRLSEVPSPTTGAPRFKMPSDERPATDSGSPRVELKRLETGETPAAKPRGALPSPSELFEDSSPQTVTPRGWPPPRVSLAEGGRTEAPSAPAVPPSVTGFPPFVEESRGSWEGPIGALERLKAGGSNPDAPPAWPPPAASSWPPAAPSTPLIPSPAPQQQQPPPPVPPPAARKPAPTAPPRKKKESSKAPLVGAIVVVVGVFSAVLLWPSGKKSPIAASSPVSLSSQAPAETKAPIPTETPKAAETQAPQTRAPEPTPSAAAVAAPVAAPSNTPSPEAKPEASSEDLPGSATPAAPETYSLNLSTEPSSVAVKIDVVGAHKYHGAGSGQVAISDVSPGTYHVKVQAAGYKPVDEKVEIGADKSMKVTLHKKATAPKPQPRAVVHSVPSRTTYQPPPVRHDPPPRAYSPPPRRVAPPSAPPRSHELRVNL